MTTASRNNPAGGGLPVIRPVPLVGDGEQGLTLLSDLHIGAANTDVDLIDQELSKALHHKDRVLIGGDVFDGIYPGDKRYCPSRVDLRIRDRSDMMDAAEELAVVILRPYANVIDMIGTGNHETAVERKNNHDPIRKLVEALNRYRSPKLRPIAHGSYTSYLSYDVVPAAGKRPAGRYVVWYHHGHGRCSDGASALKALIRQSKVFAADLYWSGHSHTRAHSSEVMVHCPKQGAAPIYRDVRCIITGSYLITYGGQSQESIEKEGRLANYASDEAMAPHGLGGARVVLEWKEPGFPTWVRVEQ